MTDKVKTLSDLVPVDLQQGMIDMAQIKLAAVQKSLDEISIQDEMVTLVLPRGMVEALIITLVRTAGANVQISTALGGVGLAETEAIGASINAGMLLWALRNYTETKPGADDV